MQVQSRLLTTELTLFLAVICIPAVLIAARPKSASYQNHTALILDTGTTLDANSLEMFVYNDGNFAYDNANVMGKTDGLYFPRGTKKTVIYAAGLWVGAKVNNDLRLAVAEYSSEFVPGPMANGTYQPDSPEFKVYKINRGDTPQSNPDYADWPVDQGAPTYPSTEPLIYGDQMTWSVFNDADPARHTNNAASTDPLGIEVQLAAFGYARSGALGQTYYLKYTIINKGGNQLDSTYVSIWADPDLGNAADDLVGCDTVLSLGYCYNDGADADYGAAPPAVGFDFLQGPTVPGAADDTAYVSGEARPGFRNLPMTSFNKYINGIDPDNPTQTYNYMKGLNNFGEPVVDPEGDTTTFVVSGDPVTGNGWIDEAPSDRRMMLSTGPFDMAPGDTQEVVVAVLVGQGTDPLNSIDALRAVDGQVQGFYDESLFSPPAYPELSVSGRGLDGAAELFWSPDLKDSTISFDALDEDFHFEGYDVYKSDGENGPWDKIATYDLIDNIRFIYNDVYNPDLGGIERVIVQNGSNSGLQFHYVDPALANGQTYYYAVTYYFYDANHITEFRDQGGNLLGHLTEVLESPKQPLAITPTASPGIVSDTADHISGSSNGLVIAEYVDPSVLTGNVYRVTVNGDNTWNLEELTKNNLLLSHEPLQPGGYGAPEVDGVMWRVISSPLGVNAVVEVQNAYGPVDPPDNVNYSLNSTRDWYIDPGSSGDLARYSWSGATSHDYEIRFTPGATEHALGFFNSGDGNYAQDIGFEVPIEFWDIGIGTPDDPSDDRRIAFMLYDYDSSGDFSWGDGLYIWDIDYDAIPWDQPGWNTGMVDPDYNQLSYGRWFFYDYSDATERPAAGTIVRTLTNKPLTTADVFELRTGSECGDVNFSGGIDVSDAVFLVNYIFAFGAAPVPGTADMNCDGKVNITDAVYLINYIFIGGPQPCAECGGAKDMSRSDLELR